MRVVYCQTKKADPGLLATPFNRILPPVIRRGLMEKLRRGTLMLKVVCGSCRTNLRVTVETLQARLTCPRCLAEIGPHVQETSLPDPAAITSTAAGKTGHPIQTGHTASTQKAVGVFQGERNQGRLLLPEEDVGRDTKVMAWLLALLALAFFVVSWADLFLGAQSQLSCASFLAAFFLALMISVVIYVQLYQPGNTAYNSSLFSTLLCILAIATVLAGFIIFFTACTRQLERTNFGR